MLKRFRQFRDNLTYKQLKRILWIVGIIIAVAYVVYLILTQPWNGYAMEDEMPFPMLVILGLISFESSILIFVWLGLGGIDKSFVHDSEQAKIRLSEKLKENELTEVYFTPSEISGDVKEFFWAPYEIFDLKYFAYKEGNKIIVRLMQGDKVLKESEPIENGRFFEKNFKFEKAKKEE